MWRNFVQIGMWVHTHNTCVVPPILLQQNKDFHCVIENPQCPGNTFSACRMLCAVYDEKRHDRRPFTLHYTLHSLFDCSVISKWNGYSNLARHWRTAEREQQKATIIGVGNGFSMDSNTEHQPDIVLNALVMAELHHYFECFSSVCALHGILIAVPGPFNLFGR